MTSGCWPGQGWSGLELGQGPSEVEKTNPQKENRGCTRLIANKYETLALFSHA